MAENARTKLQQDVKNAGDGNATGQAGDEPEAVKAPRIVPGQRLSGAEAEAALGRPADKGTNKNASDGNGDPARAGQPGGAEREALKVQHPGQAEDDTDSELPSSDQVRARAEGTAVVNPD